MMQREPTQSVNASPTRPVFAQFRPFLWRDLGLLTITIILWWAHGQSPLTGAPAYACGVLTGLCALQCHEWAHIWGAFRVRADIYPPQQLWQPFIFSFDHTTNSREAFMAVSLPAFAATAIYFALFVLWLPGAGLPGSIALIMGSITASLTLLIEVPLFVYVLVGNKVPPIEMFRRRADLTVPPNLQDPDRAHQ